MDESPRTRMIQSAALLMRERGAEATSFSEVLAHSRAPRGSIYHHFPGGKTQLIEEATRYGGDFIAAGLAAVAKQGSSLEMVDAIGEFWRSVLRQSEFAAGCPVVAATVDADHIPAVRDAAGAAFRSWEELAVEALRRDGVPEERARRLATLAIAATEGAVVLARAQRSEEPLDRVLEEVRGLVRDATAS